MPHQCCIALPDGSQCDQEAEYVVVPLRVSPHKQLHCNPLVLSPVCEVHVGRTLCLTAGAPKCTKWSVERLPADEVRL